MAKGLFEEFIGEMKKGLHEERHPLNRLKEEKKLLLDALLKLEEELRYISVHGKWSEAAEPLGYLKGLSLHHKKLDHCRGYFSSAEDLYYINLMGGEQEEIMGSLNELIHVFQREDCMEMEKTWRVKSLSRLIHDQHRREEIFYDMLEQKLSDQDLRHLAKKFEDLGYLMGEVDIFNPTMRHFDPELTKDQLEALLMSLPFKIIYKNAEEKILLLKDFPPDVEVEEWKELPQGGKLYYQLKE
ncbi:MAG: hypothetical protein GX046_04670 [Tissierellia bacterium]|nr:hypothetical protein [Tissierellia bacterium]